MKIESKTPYATVIGRSSLILFVAFIFLIIVKPDTWGIIFLLFAICELQILARKHTYTISALSTGITVNYVSFFIKKELKIPVEKLEVKLSTERAFRNPKYFVLRIYCKRKLVYSIDSRDGIEENELRQLATYYGKT